MRPIRLLACAAMAVGVMGLPVFAEPVPPTNEPTVIAQQSDQLVPLLQGISQARDPSSAIAAYAGAQAAIPNNVNVEHAYVAKMVELGLPEMADAQARDLNQRDPNDGLAWAVSAYMSARRNDTVAALSDIASATRLLPENPFVQRTAGQLMAWYDVRADLTKIPDAGKQAVAATRLAMQGKAVFTDAYRRASDEYASRNQPQQNPQEPGVAVNQPNSQPGAMSPAIPMDPYAASGPYDGGNYNTYNYYNTYTDPYVPYVYGGPYSYPGYYSGYYSSAWWPSAWWGLGFGFGNVVITDNNFRHHNNFNHGRFNHGQFNHGQFNHGQFNHGQFNNRNWNGGRFDPRMTHNNGGALRSMPHAGTSRLTTPRNVAPRNVTPRSSAAMPRNFAAAPRSAPMHSGGFGGGAPARGGVGGAHGGMGAAGHAGGGGGGGGGHGGGGGGGHR